MFVLSIEVPSCGFNHFFERFALEVGMIEEVFLLVRIDGRLILTEGLIEGDGNAAINEGFDDAEERFGRGLLGMLAFDLLCHSWGLSRLACKLPSLPSEKHEAC